MVTSLDKNLRDSLAEKDKIQRSGNLRWYHFLIIAASLFSTFVAWQITKTQSEDRISANFNREVNQSLELIIERMKTYEDTLRNAAAFQLSQNGLTDTHIWRQYAETLDIHNRYPGINGIGIIHNIEPHQREMYIDFMRKDRPDFTIYPPHSESELFPIAFIEPLATNAAAVGLDMAHETNRFTAAKLARDTGEPQITGPIILVQDSEKSPGFLFFMPYYREAPSLNDPEKSRQISALTYAPFIFSKLMEGIWGQQRRQVDVKIIDDGTILYDNHDENDPNYDPNPLFKTSNTVEMYGRSWQIEFRADKSFRAANTKNFHWIVLFGGLTINLLMLSAFLFLAASNRRAVRFATRLAKNHEANSILLSNVIENAVDGLLRTDAKGYIVSFNKACSKIYGYEAKDILGKHISSLVKGEHVWDETFQGKTVEFQGLRKNGEAFPVETSTTILFIDGEKYYSSIVRDITKRKETERAIQKTVEELQLSNADLEKFAYIASHDLKSPLRAIDNLSSWIVEDIEPLMDERNKDRFEKLRGRVARMERLLNDLLQYSRAANKTYPPEPVKADVLIHDIAQTLDVPEGFEIKTEGEMDKIEISRMPIEQVFHNLISNAIKHHDRDTGTITISAKTRHNRFEFSVTDDGPGMRKEYHERIFEMFQTLRRRDEVEASGIGLAVVKKIVQRYGGRIWVDSAPGEGTTFTFTWRRNAEEIRTAA